MAQRWKTGEIARIAQHARSVISRHGLTIKASPCFSCSASAPISLGRFVVVVPKRVGNAPIRNRCKRRVRALIAALGKEACARDIFAHVNLMIYVRKSIASMPYQLLEALFRDLVLLLMEHQVPLVSATRES